MLNDVFQLKMRPSIKRELRAFLKKEGALEQFVKNCKSEECNGAFLDEIPYRVETISEGFIWKDSPEGQEFWDELYCKYSSELKKK